MKLTRTFAASLGLAIIWPLLFTAPAARAQFNIDPSFNPNQIINDTDLLDYNSLSLTDIQNFLQNQGSFLAGYVTPDTNGVIKSAAQIIYDATNNNYDCDGVTLSATPTVAEKSVKCQHITTVNPKLILVLLQKEASLISDPNPPQSHLDWAAGYGCPDGWVCNPYYKGFGKQVNSAALQFRDYMLNPQQYPFQAGQAYEVSNTLGPYASATANQTTIVIPQNQATAALYDYTPHVFNGNYNFYKFWNAYFPQVDRIYPDGSVIQAAGDPNVWLIENGAKRQFANWSAFTSRFSPNQIVAVTAADLNNYPTGDEIKFANYSLVRTPDKKIYLLVDQTKRPFASAAVFQKIGFNPAELEDALPADLSAYGTGTPVTATSSDLTGILMQDSKTNDVYYVQNGARALVDKTLLPLKFPDQKIVKKTTKQLAKYATTTPVLLDEGTLVKTPSFPTVYLISDGQKRPFADPSVFTKLNYNPANVITVSSQLLYNYDMGEPIQ